MTTRILKPADAATMLRERGIQPASVATPSAMTEALCRACGDHGLSVRSVPTDFDAIRAELVGLWPSPAPALSGEGRRIFAQASASARLDAEGSRRG